MRDTWMNFEVLPTKELKKMVENINAILKEREEEKEKLRRKYQEELDILLDAIEGDGFYVGTPDYPSSRVVVLEEGETK